jgi:Tat protein secretion system quality control protein TatD with DNase activity
MEKESSKRIGLVDSHAHLDELNDLPEALQEAKAAGVYGIIAVENILLETDTPVNYQGKEVRPKDVQITLREVARLKGLDPLAVSHQTTANVSSFFRISFRP